MTRSIASRRLADLPGWPPLVGLPAGVIAALYTAQPWVFMWTLSVAIFAGFKWLTWWRVRGSSGSWRGWRPLAYLFAWPGMDAGAFLDTAQRPVPPATGEWLAALLKTFFGATLFWGLARVAVTAAPLAAGWIGLFGLIFLLHFGSFHLLSLAWRRAGIRARPIMDAPVQATSLGDLWGRRWNLAFHQLARDLVVGVTRDRVGPVAATLLAFSASGLIHDLAISVPARGGYGLPTAYFLLQGIGLLFERSRPGTRLGLRGGVRGRIYALLVAGLPAFWLFHPPFVLRVMVPFMRAVGALP